MHKKSIDQVVRCNKLICKSSVIINVHVKYYYTHSLESSEMKGNNVIPCFNMIGKELWIPFSVLLAFSLFFHGTGSELDNFIFTLFNVMLTSLYVSSRMSHKI